MRWQHAEGRTAEGEKFNTYLCVHPSGRLVGRVICPVGDEFSFAPIFYAPEALIKDAETYRFIDLASAQAFVAEWAGRLVDTGTWMK
jgi:hypothetical protein